MNTRTLFLFTFLFSVVAGFYLAMVIFSVKQNSHTHSWNKWEQDGDKRNFEGYRWMFRKCDSCGMYQERAAESAGW